MFDIGFTELLLCLVVALVVIGPEQLPETVRTIGLWIGRLKRSLRETRSEIERQIGADDIRRQLHNEEIMRSLEETRRSMEEAIQQGEQQAQTALDPDEEARRQAQQRDYGAPEELPDHAHQTAAAHSTPIADNQQPAEASTPHQEQTASADAPPQPDPTKP